MKKFLPKGTEMNRRERRRLEKRLRKARRIAYCTRKSVPSQSNQASQNPQPTIPMATNQNQKKRPSKKKPKEKLKSQRQEQQRDLIDMEEREIRSFAKKLGLNKRRKKETIPKSFADAGLDYILQFCQSAGKSHEDDDSSENFSNSDLESNPDESDPDKDESDIHTLSVSKPKETESSEKTVVQSKKRKNQEKASVEPTTSKKRVRFADVLGDDQMNEELGSEKSDRESGDELELHEDIYGRLRDKKGNIVQRDLQLSTRPKFISTTDSSGDIQVDQKLLRTVKGALNRLSESNARQISTQIGQLLITYSKNDVKTTLMNATFGVCLVRELVPPRLIMEHCFLLALLHSSIGVELSAYFIERLANEFRNLHKMGLSDDQAAMSDKRLNNICQIFIFCYHLKIISNVLVVQLLNDLVMEFTERDIELILLVLQNVGFVLRKDDPMALKSLIVDVHKKINDPLNAHLKNEARTRFMLDTLSAIKNNNDMKITNYDPSLPEHFRKLLRGAVKSIEPPLPMGLHDIYEADEKGRWWIVGSAVSSNFLESRKAEGAKSKSESAMKTEFSDALLELARKHRMNTDLRRTIFCIIMSAEDYLDAFEKLIKLDLRGQQEREVIHVCLMCCLNERQFNQYYGLLIRQLCQCHKRFQLTTQFSCWDKFKLLKDLKPWQCKNLASLMSQLIRCKSISLAVLKVFEFGELEPEAMKFLKSFFKDLLLNSSSTEITEIFKRLTMKDELKVLFDGMLVFLQHYFSRSTGKFSEQHRRVLNERITLIEKLRST